MIRFEVFESLGVSVAAFSDKSDGDCNLRRANPEAGMRGRRTLCLQCGVNPADLVCGQQIHGTHVAVVKEEDRGRGALAWEDGLPDTDGLVTNVKGLPVAVVVADCVPIYLVDPTQGVGGLIHAGRRGIMGNVSAKAVETLSNAFGTRPESIHALIGPSAGPTRYEVSEEIAEAWRNNGLPAAGRLLDLWEANAQQLVGAGVPRGQIIVAGICTVGDGRFFSHRAAPGGGRNAALLML